MALCLSLSIDTGGRGKARLRTRMEKLKCQRIGCEALLTEDENQEDSYTYHDSCPIFHDGMKEWSCCKKKSHDFSLFLALPGCKTGKHTTEKLVLPKKTPAPKQPVYETSAAFNSSSKDSCSRCRQGFFCSDPGSQAGALNSKVSKSVLDAPTEINQNFQDAQPPKPKKIVDINQHQTCKNKGRGKTFKEKDNHDEACIYHPGPAVFHDRIRGLRIQVACVFS